jgi:pimeloyl-ACP methyl ester carboxylesterase
MRVEATTARARHTITVGDGTEIFFKDWGTGAPIVFSHGSPLNSDAWEDQMVFLADRGAGLCSVSVSGDGSARRSPSTRRADAKRPASTHHLRSVSQ